MSEIFRYAGSREATAAKTTATVSRPHGDSVFNERDSRTLKQKPAKEHVTTEVPTIISKAEFEAVAASLKLRNPRTTAPRVVTGPILLTGVAVCGGCDGAMTLRTGTSSTGKIHKYYACSTCARQGKTA